MNNNEEIIMQKQLDMTEFFQIKELSTSSMGSEIKSEAIKITISTIAMQMRKI